MTVTCILCLLEQFLSHFLLAVCLCLCPLTRLAGPYDTLHPQGSLTCPQQWGLQAQAGQAPGRPKGTGGQTTQARADKGTSGEG